MNDIDRVSRYHQRLKTVDERFREKYVVNEETGCWDWTGSADHGYGRFHDPAEGRLVQAHRFAYEHLVGPIPDGLHLDHLCRNRGCVNPAHLEVVTNRENILRGEGTSAANARKTHCYKGHEFSPENTYYYGNGRKRQCRQCRIEYLAEHGRSEARR